MNKNKRDFMNPLSLRFKSKDTEEKFLSKELQIQSKSLKRLVTLFTVYFFFSGLLAEIGQWDNKNYWWLRFGCSSGILITILILMRFKRMVEQTQYFLSACLSGFFFHNCEIIRGNFHQLTQGQIFYQANLSVICLIYLIILRVSWRMNAILIVSSAFYCGVQFLDIFNYKQKDYLFNAALLVIGTSFWMYVNYKHERHERLEFFKLIKSKEHLSYYKQLVEEVIPTPILIFPYDKKGESKLKNLPLLYNKAADRLFGECIRENNDSLEQITKEFSVEEYGDLMEKKQKRFNKQVINITPSCDLKRNFLEIIKLKEGDSSSEFNSFKTFTASYKSGSERRQYEIKHGIIQWGIENEEKSVTAVLFLFNDITLTNKLTELQVMDQNKDRMLATISHELKTPLNGILGNLELFLSEFKFPSTEKSFRKNIKVALRSGLLLLEFINNILDYSSMAKNTLVLEMKEVSINELLEYLKSLFKYQMKSKNLAFTIVNELELSEHIWADPIKLKQVLVNLLSNALKYTTKGHVRLTISRVSSEISQDSDDLEPHAIITVEDSGCGIKSEYIPLLFNFNLRKNIHSTSDPSENSNKIGVGLGLSLSQALIQSMAVHQSEPNSLISKGIQVQSIAGQGTKFFFYLKLVDKTGTSNLLESNKGWMETRTKSGIRSIYRSHSFKKVCLDTPQRSIKNLIELNKINSSSSSSSDYDKKKQERSNNLYKDPSSLRRYALVVDDDQINLMVAVNYLKMFDFDFETASNGLDALETVKKKAKENIYFDLILMDCNMPVMDGYEATKQIKEFLRDNQLKKTVIIAVTANSEPRDIEFCFEAGMDFYLNKPLSKARFMELLPQIF